MAQTLDDINAAEGFLRALVAQLAGISPSGLETVAQQMIVQINNIEQARLDVAAAIAANAAPQ